MCLHILKVNLSQQQACIFNIFWTQWKQAWFFKPFWQIIFMWSFSVSHNQDVQCSTNYEGHQIHVCHYHDWKVELNYHMHKGPNKSNIVESNTHVKLKFKCWLIFWSILTSVKFDLIPKGSETCFLPFIMKIECNK